MSSLVIYGMVKVISIRHARLFVYPSDANLIPIRHTTNMRHGIRGGRWHLEVREETKVERVFVRVVYGLRTRHTLQGR